MHKLSYKVTTVSEHKTCTQLLEAFMQSFFDTHLARHSCLSVSKNTELQSTASDSTVAWRCPLVEGTRTQEAFGSVFKPLSNGVFQKSQPCWVRVYCYASRTAGLVRNPISEQSMQHNICTNFYWLIWNLVAGKSSS